MEHLNQTSYCSSLGAAALLISRMMFAWMGRRDFTGNTMLRSSYVLPLLPGPCPAWQSFTCIYSFILKEIRSVFQCCSKSTSNKSKTQKYKQEKQELFIIMRSSASSSHKHSDSSKYSWQCYTTPELYSPVAWQVFKRSCILKRLINHRKSIQPSQYI